MNFRCKIGWHDYVDEGTSTTKNIRFGWASSPGMRLKQRCKHCGNVHYMNLNLMMPDKYLYEEHLWTK